MTAGKEVSPRARLFTFSRCHDREELHSSRRPLVS